MGRVAEGVQWFEKAIQRAREDHDLFMLGVACADYGGMYADVGDAQVALAHARQGVELGGEGRGPASREPSPTHSSDVRTSVWVRTQKR